MSGQNSPPVAPKTCPACGAVLLPGGTHTNGRQAAGGSSRSTPDQTALDRDQTTSDRDQTAGDRDQTSSDRDQSASDRDQQSSIEDQQASDDNLAEGSDPAVHERSRVAREKTTHEREDASALRETAADDRQETADERDRVAEVRDHTADERDRKAERRDRVADVLDAAAALRDRGPEPSLDEESSPNAPHLQAERDRARAAADRATAARDRERAARDRKEAAELRLASARDRAQAELANRLAGIDQLTGVSLRSIGLVEIEREIQRARRTGKRLVIAFVDVNNLKGVNDSEGHLAGDSLLRHVSEALREKLRPYDVIVRFGGDEFICAISNVDTKTVERRFDGVVAMLAAAGRPEPISFGVAELADDDDLEGLVARADEKLLKSRRAGGHYSTKTAET